MSDDSLQFQERSEAGIGSLNTGCWSTVCQRVDTVGGLVENTKVIMVCCIDIICLVELQLIHKSCLMHLYPI